MAIEQISIGVSPHIAQYSDAIVVPAGYRWLFTAGTPALNSDGILPEGIEAQSRAAWGNVFEVLKKAGMGPEHIVKVVSTLTDTSNIAEYARVRRELMGDYRPAFMLQVVDQMIKKEFLVEIEVIAAAP